MPRPQKKRRVCALPGVHCFAPEGVPAAGVVEMSIDEYETIRLMDLLGRTQEDCAVQMGVARTTVQAVYGSARRKLAEALTEGKRLEIRGGQVTLCEAAERCCGKNCRRESCEKGACHHGCRRRNQA